MLRIQAITKNAKDFPVVASLYASAFPAAEQAPMPYLLKRAMKDYVDFHAYYDGEVFVGFTYSMTRENLTFIMYLAIDANHRAKGYGSQILSHIKEAYPNNRIILNIEIEDETAENNAERKKRKQFYMRNGYHSSGVFLKIMGVTYELLVCNGDCTAEEFLTLNKKFMGSLLFLFFKPKLIHPTV